MLMNVRLRMMVHHVHLKLRNVLTPSVHIDVTVPTAFTGEIANAKRRKNVSDVVSVIRIYNAEIDFKT